MMLRRSRIAILTAIILLISATRASGVDAPTIRSEELDQVFQAVRVGDWPRVEKHVLPLLDRPSKAQSYLIGRLRYIYLFAVVNQLDGGGLRYTDLKKKLKVVEEKFVVQPWHPVKGDGHSCFNQICPDPENPEILFTVQANGKASQIYSFEYFDMGGPVDIRSFDGQNARLAGILKKVEINENLEKAQNSGSGVSWYLQLRFKDGVIAHER